MKTFSEYVQATIIQPKMNEVAHRLAGSGMDPFEVIGNYLEHNHPQLAENWWQGIKDTVTGWFDGGVGKAGRENRPMQHITAAMEALKKLEQVLKDNQGADAPTIQHALQALGNVTGQMQNLQKTVQPLEDTISQYAVSRISTGGKASFKGTHDFSDLKGLPDDPNKWLAWYHDKATGDPATDARKQQIAQDAEQLGWSHRVKKPGGMASTTPLYTHAASGYTAPDEMSSNLAQAIERYRKVAK